MYHFARILDSIRIDTETLDCYDGQCNKVKIAKDEDKVIGYLEYAVYEEKPYIQMIEVAEDYRRQGIATMLLQSLQREYPNSDIETGMMTESGVKLFEKVSKLKKNPVYTRYLNRIVKLNERIDELKTQFDLNFEDKISLSIEELEKMNDEYNQLILEVRDLEKRLSITPQEFRYIKDSDSLLSRLKEIEEALIKEFGANFASRENIDCPMCDDICKYVYDNLLTDEERANSELIHKFILYKKDDSDNMIVITTSGHYCIKYKDKIIDFSNKQFENNDNPNIIVFDKITNNTYKYKNLYIEI